MKVHIVFIALVTFFVSCKKKNVLPTERSDSAAILLIGDSLESVYIYDLESIPLVNDSLPISIESSFDPNSMEQLTYCTFGANPDTLFSSIAGNYTFYGKEIYLPPLHSLMAPITFDNNKFQQVSSQSVLNVEEVWKKVSKLALVHNYWNSNPNAKIGISRHIVTVYDESLGFSIPKEKWMLFLFK